MELQMSCADEKFRLIIDKTLPQYAHEKGLQNSLLLQFIVL